MMDQEIKEKIPLKIYFVLFVSFLSILSIVGQITILGKQVYDITGRELDLGLLGLAEFAPTFLLAPFTGPLADRIAKTIVKYTVFFVFRPSRPSPKSSKNAPKTALVATFPSVFEFGCNSYKQSQNVGPKRIPPQA